VARRQEAAAGASPPVEKLARIFVTSIKAYMIFKIRVEQRLVAEKYQKGNHKRQNGRYDC